MEIRNQKKIALQLTIVTTALLLGLAILRQVQAVAAYTSPPAAMAITGAIYTTVNDGSAVNTNIFQTCTDVYIAGGPQNENGSGLPPGTYYFQVTTPNGTLLSTDDAVCRQLTVNDKGVIAGAVTVAGCTPHMNGTPNNGNGATPVQLYPFNPTTNPGGEYKVWLIKNTATIDPTDSKKLIFDNSDSKTDNFKSKGCPGQAAQYAIGGVKYSDLDADGVLDQGEPGIPGITISVMVNNDPNPITTQTNDKGEWSLVFPVGTRYTACEVLPTDTVYTQTGPKDGDTVNYLSGTKAASAQGKCWTGDVAASDLLTGLNFGNAVCTQMTCPTSVTVECGSDTSPETTGKPTALCTGMEITYKDLFAPACGKTGVITRTWTIKDGTGHTSSCEQKITIEDTTKPTISGVGGSETIECSATPKFSEPTVSDTCGDAKFLSIENKTTPGSCAANYSITRTWTAIDACGNKSEPVSQTITVVDKTPPTFNNDGGANAVIYCPATPVFKAPTATDSCSTASVFVVSDLTTSASCGTYSRTITWGTKDDCGNTSKETRSQTIEVRCNGCGEGTIGFWQNKNGQDLIKTADQAKLKAYLTTYNPFKDLTTQVIATYVTNVVKSASASGAAMNAMLKAQMLSTALDVYFGKVLGTANIDLTYINKPIGSTTYQTVSSSFGGANCMSVNDMLTYAASRADVGGLVWYAQVKSGPNSQELAKDAFDAINNQKAFSVFKCQ